MKANITYGQLLDFMKHIKEHCSTYGVKVRRDSVLDITIDKNGISAYLDVHSK